MALGSKSRQGLPEKWVLASTFPILVYRLVSPLDGMDGLR
jgi:hypothetical protein